MTTESSNASLDTKIERFIAEKRLFGYRYKSGEATLHSFQKFVINNHLDPVVTKDTVMKWVDNSISTESRNGKISVVREFALFLNRLGDAAYVVPTAYNSIRHKDFCPYIYSRKELSAIFQASERFGKVSNIPYSELSFPLIIRMLYGCGLRISEALSLSINHVDLYRGVLTVEDTKFFKNRLIPMHENLTRRCFEYSQKALVFASKEDFFFLYNKPCRIPNSVFYQYFRKVLDTCGIRSMAADRGPRVHDMRHTFAVHCLKKLDDAGMDMNAVLPVLATYMGHTTYEGTGTYLRLTAELHSQVANMVDEQFGHLIPPGGEESES